MATLTALFLLHTRFQEWQAEWALVAAKAERWLQARNFTLRPPGPELLPWLLPILRDFFSLSAQETEKEDKQP